MALDRTHLELRGRTYYAVIEVPPSLRPKLGRKRLRKSLKTDSLSLAVIRKLPVVAELKATIARARDGAKGEPLSHEALEWRREIEDAEKAVNLARNGSEDAWREASERLAALQMLLEERAETIAEQPRRHLKDGMGLGQEVAQSFHGIASGRSTPINLHVEEWLAASHYVDRTKKDHRHALKELEAWLTATHRAITLEAVTGREASGFRAALIERGGHHKTINKSLSSLRSYWDWLTRSEYAAANPWLKKSIPKPKVQSQDELERPFTDDEVDALFASNPTDDVRDTMAIAALSGLRVEEIFQLRIGDCSDAVFSIRKSKTKAGIRKVPIHQLLKAIVGRRSSNRAADAYLFPNEQPTGHDGARSMAFTKRFATYRRSCGVDDVSDGKGGERRRSRVNFHSFRRWFATKCEVAGVQENLVARVLGHKVQGMSFGLYSGGVDLAQLAMVVTSVRPDTRNSMAMTLLRLSNQWAVAAEKLGGRGGAEAPRKPRPATSLSDKPKAGTDFAHGRKSISLPAPSGQTRRSKSTTIG